MTRTVLTPAGPSRDALPPESAELFEAIAELKTADETAAFLRDLCTIAELRAMSGRWQVALLLDQGMHYLEIADVYKRQRQTDSRGNSRRQWAIASR